MLVTPMDVRSKDGDVLIRHYKPGDQIEESPGDTILAPCTCKTDKEIEKEFDRNKKSWPPRRKD